MSLSINYTLQVYTNYQSLIGRKYAEKHFILLSTTNIHLNFFIDLSFRVLMA